MKYGHCLNHPKTYASNSRGLCPTCTKERREYSAASKGIITKSAKAKIEEDGTREIAGIFEEQRNAKEDNSGVEQSAKVPESTPTPFLFNNGSRQGIRKENDSAFHRELVRKQRMRFSESSNLSGKKKKAKTKINPRSEKNKSIVAQELLMFKQIWDERPHFCEVSGKPIRFFHPACFSHVLAKGAYPKFRLYKKNIVLCLYEWHHKWEFETRKIPELSWIETLESALKTEYYNGK